MTACVYTVSASNSSLLKVMLYTHPMGQEIAGNVELAGAYAVGGFVGEVLMTAMLGIVIIAVCECTRRLAHT